MKRGFTIVELVIVIVLLAVVFVTVWTSLTPMVGNILDIAIRRIDSDLHYAQSMAVNTKDWYGVKFSTSGNSYYVYKGLASSGTPITNPANMQPFQINVFGMYSGIDITSVQRKFGFIWISFDYILFNSQGAPCDSSGTPFSGEYKIKITYDPRACGQSPYSRWLYISPQSGKSRIEVD